MTVEVAAAETATVTVTVQEKIVEKEACGLNDEKEDCISTAGGKSSSYREESNFLSDLKESERKALNELKSRLEKSILEHNFMNGEKKESDLKPSRPADEAKEKEKPAENCEHEKRDDDQVAEDNKTSSESTKTDQKTEGEGGKCRNTEEEVEVFQDISIWGVPLLPSKGDERTDVVLLKFLRAREFKVNDALQMLQKSLQWRKEFEVDSILDEEFDPDLASASYLSGTDRQGHPICYNAFGILLNEANYGKTLEKEADGEQFLRWRVQLMEKSIQRLDFRPGGVSSLLQINDLKNSPGLTRREVRSAVTKTVSLLQDNYPEFVAKNIFVNAPFWYFAFHSLISPFLTQRSKSKIVFARPSKVTETLLKYVPIQEIPVQYGGIQRENDFEFFGNDGEVSEAVVKAGSATAIEISVPEAGTMITWEVLTLGWEVNYTEEFIPADENSYTKIIQKRRKMCAEDTAVRNTFKSEEAGKIVITVDNSSRKKRKVFYRYKMKKSFF